MLVLKELVFKILLLVIKELQTRLTFLPLGAAFHIQYCTFRSLVDLHTSFQVKVAFHSLLLQTFLASLLPFLDSFPLDLAAFPSGSFPWDSYPLGSYLHLTLAYFLRS